MKEISYSEFTKKIAEDYNLIQKKKIKRYFTDFPIVNGKRKINAIASSVIVDKDNNEFPYMLSAPWEHAVRNNDKLIEFNYIYDITYKSLEELLQEANIKLKTEPCKVCEGNGWYTNGTRYYYKEYYIEK